jgi:hypothetical protein
MQRSVQQAERAAGLQGWVIPDAPSVPVALRGPRPPSRARVELEARGARVESVEVSQTVSVGPISSHRVGVREAWTLPVHCPVQATFGSEGLLAKLRKLFTSEVQTGDAAFDAAVFIETTTVEATRAWLVSDGVRQGILQVVRSGESFSVEGNIARGAITWGVDESDTPDVITLLVASLPTS